LVVVYFKVNHFRQLHGDSGWSLTSFSRHLIWRLIRLGVVRGMPATKLPKLRHRALDLVAHGNPIGQEASDLGISELCLRRWMCIDDIEAFHNEGLSSAERKELVEFGHRNRML